MPFQKQVQRYPAKGVTGMQAGNNPIAFYLPIPIAGEDGVIIGRAAWPGTVAGTAANTGSGAPLGIVIREKVAVIPCGEEATMTYIAGQAVPIAVRGDLLLTSAQAVTAGQKLFARTARWCRARRGARWPTPWKQPGWCARTPPPGKSSTPPRGERREHESTRS